MKHIARNGALSKELIGVPFIVPGGRFNEMYGWDSYFCYVGLLTTGKIHLVQSIVENFIFEIEKYGKILNANRSYYIGRSQPPFLTDLTLRTFELIKSEPGAQNFLKDAFLAAIKEYYDVWMAEPRLDQSSGLSRYRPEGRGIPLETEPRHYLHVLKPYLEKYSLSHDEFVAQYNDGKIKEPDLDIFFLHDRAVRESGHDTTLRLESAAADIATIDLNCLLYKYEMDIATVIATFFGDKMLVPQASCAQGQMEHYEVSHTWTEKAAKRKRAINQQLWREEKGMYYDFNTVLKEQTKFESVTSFWALWSGVASPYQADQLVSRWLPSFENNGGLTATLESSPLTAEYHRQRQWDFPNGWAPHQVMAWDGLLRYGYDKEARRLIYRWLYTITRTFVDFNGTVVEKYDVTADEAAQVVEAEYGNQGIDFSGVPSEGFGWTNASFVYGLSLLDRRMKRILGLVVPFDDLSIES